MALRGNVQKFKELVKKYWYVAIPVHMGTSVGWFGASYGANKAGLDFMPVLEKIGVPEYYVQPLKSGNLGNVAQAFILYKILTPFRYATTIGVTGSAIKYLRKRSMIK